MLMIRIWMAFVRNSSKNCLSTLKVSEHEIWFMITVFQLNKAEIKVFRETLQLRAVDHNAKNATQILLKWNRNDIQGKMQTVVF
jgi:hypothetical protein